MFRPPSHNILYHASRNILQDIFNGLSDTHIFINIFVRSLTHICHLHGLNYYKVHPPTRNNTRQVCACLYLCVKPKARWGYNIHFSTCVISTKKSKKQPKTAYLQTPIFRLRSFHGNINIYMELYAFGSVWWCSFGVVFSGAFRGYILGQILLEVAGRGLWEGAVLNGSGDGLT